MGVINFLANNGHIVVSKFLIHQIGLEETVLLGELCAEYGYWENIKKLEEGFFPSSVENIEVQTTFKKKKQQELLNNLAEKKLIEIKKDGYPAKRLIKIDEKAILDLIVQLVQNDPTDNAVGSNRADINKNNSIYNSKYYYNNSYYNNNSNYNNSNYNIRSKEKEKKNIKKKRKRKEEEQVYTIGEFGNVKLSLQEIDKLITLYGSEKNLDIAIDILGNYIESSGHKYKSHYAVLRKNNWVYKKFKQEYKQ